MTRITCTRDTLGNYWLRCGADAGGPCVCGVVVATLPTMNLQFEGEQLALEIAANEDLGFIETLVAAAERLDGLLAYAARWDADAAALV